MRFIGDVHCKFDKYLEILEGTDGPTIQVGDFGVGFPDQPEDFLRDMLGYMSSHDHSFILGNHDNPHFSAQFPCFLKSGTSIEDIFVVGGAQSIDFAQRKEGIDWWKEEQHTYDEFGDLLELYEAAKPRIMVTHDIPYGLIPHIFPKSHPFKSITGQALDMFFSVHKPDIWVFGHWHRSVDKTILGTRFICLNELEVIDI